MKSCSFDHYNVTLLKHHYSDVIMSVMASQITSLTIVYSTVYSGADQRTHQCSESLAFVRGIHWWPVNSPHKGPVMQKMFPFDDIILMVDFLPNTHIRHHIAHMRSSNMRGLWGLLTHFPLNKIAAISQMLISDTFSWMKYSVFWTKFHWSLFLSVQLTITRH